MKKKIVIAALIAALSPVGLSAQAKPAETRAVVSTAGLDLRTAAGVRALDLRILHAASALCDTGSSADARAQIKYKACYDEARTKAEIQRDRIMAAALRDRDLRSAHR